MNIETISMDPKQAAVAFREYRAAVKLATNARRQKEDEQVMRACKAASKGLQLLDLHQVMKAAGVFESGYPKLAIARADQERCVVRMNFNGSAQFVHDSNVFWSRRRSAQGLITDVPTGTFPRSSGGKNDALALVPTIPPALRPKHALSNYHILWEAVWEPAPPVDPLLLKHLGGALYAVLAAWDLTPIERAVLRGRLVTA